MGSKYRRLSELGSLLGLSNFDPIGEVTLILRDLNISKKILTSYSPPSCKMYQYFNGNLRGHIWTQNWMLRQALPFKVVLQSQGSET